MYEFKIQYVRKTQSAQLCSRRNSMNSFAYSARACADNHRTTAFNNYSSATLVYDNVRVVSGMEFITYLLEPNGGFVAEVLMRLLLPGRGRSKYINTA